MLEQIRGWRIRAGIVGATLSLLSLGRPADVEAQSDSSPTLTGHRVIILQGFGAVHLAGTSGPPQTRVGINLVMPVQRVDGQRLWLVSTSGGDSGWVDRGSVLLLEDAMAHFDTLLVRDPRNWDAYLRRAETEHALNLRDAATADYSRAIELHPKEAFLYLRRGRHYNTMKECAKAITDFERAVELAPTSAPQDYNLIAELHSLESGVYFACSDTAFRDYPRGLALAKLAVRQDPSRATLVTILAAAYARAGDLSSAVKTQREALARPDFPPAYRADAEQALAKYVAAAEQRPR